MHIPVMMSEVIECLALQPDGIYVDATFGGGGYSRAILETLPSLKVYATDRDPEAIPRGDCLNQEFPNRFQVQQARFTELCSALEGLAGQVDGVVFDLGVSSFQLDTAERGFSFRHDGPLDMRMTPTGATAADLVNTLPEAELANIIYEFGEERHSRRVARAIVKQRQQKPYATTRELAETVRAVVHATPHGPDPATRTFQALRIAVNEELDEIRQGLAAAAFLLKPGGRLVVVSFHSLEDRIIKHALQTVRAQILGPMRLIQPDAREEGWFKMLQRRAIVPSDLETRANPRARSAKLRAAERTSAPFVKGDSVCSA